VEDRVIDIVDKFGYVGIAGLVALETVFPPIPSEVILPLAGFLTGQGELTLWGVILCATIGSVVGALILYFVARWFGRERIYVLTGRYGKFFLLKESDLDRAESWFDRHSNKAVLLGRLVPGVRSVISLPAGVTSMPLGPFLLYTTLGSAIWNSLLVGAGWALGNQWEKVEGVVSYVQYGVILAILLAIVWFAWSRRETWRSWVFRRGN
jgi:membrane protein DedA with SNARE-associated domain